MGARVFLSGPLGHLPLLRLVLGGEPRVEAVEPAGVLLDPDPEERARLEHYAGAAGLVRAERGGVLCFELPPGREGPQDEALAADVMALMGRVPAAALAARRGPMRVRAASRLRAEAEPAPASLRRAAAPDDIEILERRQPYAGFFAVEEYDLRHRRFDGTMSAPVTRAAFISGDAVTVLPWDRARDRVLVIEQFRAGPLARGDRNPWTLEAVAGRIDPGETPEQAARREAGEEAGLTLGRMWKVGGYYPTPGAKAEFILSWVAEAELPDEAATLGGVADEAEDIRGHVIPFARLLELIDTGEVANAPLIVTALWLERHRKGLG